MKSDLFIPSEETDKNNYYLFLFSRLNGVGSKTIIALLQKFGSPSNLYQAVLDQKQILNNKIYYLLQDKNFILDSQKAFEALAEDYITILNPLYPSDLKNIYDPPLFLFYKGT
jgi:DNA processing protein